MINYTHEAGRVYFHFVRIYYLTSNSKVYIR